MRRRKINFGLLFGGILTLVAIGTVGAFLRPVHEPDQVVPTRFGDVPWNHELHARMKEIANCQVCHHKERQGTSKPRPCRSCHKPLTHNAALIVGELHKKVVPGEKAKPPIYKDDNGPPPMTAFHAKCVGCHRTMKRGPVVCRDCHAQKFSGEHGVVTWDHMAHARRIDMGMEGGLANNCVKCHHQDKNAETDADYRPCGACHQPAKESNLKVDTGIKSHEKLKHGDCKRCHTLFNPEEVHQGCKGCHKGWDVPLPVTSPDGQRPAIEQAMHMRCLECHNQNYKGLTEGMPTRCDDCHRPDPSVLGNLNVGLILWDHDRHTTYGKDMKCTTCHHTDAEGQPHMACARCHGTGLYENPPVAEALRKRCLGCHTEKKNGLVTWEHINTKRKIGEINRYKFEEARPEATEDYQKRSFWWDHRAHATGWSFSCRNCHHGLLRDEEGNYLTGEKIGAAWNGEATHIQACTTCHGPNGPVAKSPAAGSKAPSHSAAYEKVCTACHQKLGGGPQQWDDFFKVEPVEKAPAEEQEP